MSREMTCAVLSHRADEVFWHPLLVDLTMKFASIIALVALCSWVSLAPAHAGIWESNDDPNASSTWLKYCQSSVQAERDDCQSFFWGVVSDHMWMTYLSNGTQIGWCDRDGSSIVQKVDAWIRYMKIHPDDAKGPPAATFFVAMKQFLPCQGK